MKIAIVGATGLVGTKMIEILNERNFPYTELILVASEKSIGKEIDINGKIHTVVSYQEAINQKPNLALFSAGGTTSLELAPKFAEAGITVIDNSSAWRMDATKKLIVPEINGCQLNKNDKIIANPNCSTIQMVMVLKPLHDAFKIKRVVVSTYQSVTGSGIKAINQLMDERNENEIDKCYPYQIDMNIIPQIDVFTENGYTKEEMKMIAETKKILSDDSLKITSTTVRIPVRGGHSESVNIEFEKPFVIDEVRTLLSKFDGVTIQDDIKNLVYPMPLFAEGKDDVFVGRIRRDDSIENGLNCWIVSDNLRKGAATNAVQIAEYLLKNNLI
ncbi:MAG: aspartate-semialdehyde dehydrogenase [Chitinophagaceae bacterium]|nr:aspartate-semialdehyde dehydrogenase [Chitinophagaceae bacterium]